MASVARPESGQIQEPGIPLGSHVVVGDQALEPPSAAIPDTLVEKHQD